MANKLKKSKAKARSKAPETDELLDDDQESGVKQERSSKKKKSGKAEGMDQMKDDESDNPKSTVKRTEDAATWQKRYELAYRNEKSLKKKWSEWYEQMYAVKTYKNISIWKSKMFIPVLSYKAWTIIAKLLAMRPGFSVKMYDELYSDQDRKYIEKANLKLEYDYDNPMLDESIRDKLHDIFTDATVCGTGFGKAEWISGTKTFYNHFKRNDGTIDYSQSEKKEVETGFNDLEPVNAFDVFGAPGKRNWESKPWQIIKYKKTRSELLESGLYDETVVNRIKPAGKSNDVINKYKQSRDQFIGENQNDQETLDDTVDTFSVFECYEKVNGKVYLMTFMLGTDDGDADTNNKSESNDSGEDGNWHEIRNEKQPYWHNKYPLQAAYIRRKPHHCYGESIFEVTESMANGYNDIVNQLADNLAIVGNGGVLFHETSTTIYDFYYAPGGEVRYSGTKPEFEVPKSPDIQLFTTMLNLIDSGVTNATVSPYASGTPSDQNDNTQGTLGGINALQEAAGEITSFMKGGVMQFVKGVGVRWLSNNRQFLDEAITIQQTRYGKKRVYRITSDDFLETMMLTIDEDSMTPVTKQQQREDNTAWISSLVTVQDRSLQQAGLTPNPAVPPQMDPVSGQPIPPPQNPKIKPIYLDWQKIAAEVNESYNKPDISEFLLDIDSEEDSEDTDISAMIEAIRSLVEDGSMDGSAAQAMIDELEGRVPTVTPQISLEDGGDENYEIDETPEQLAERAIAIGQAGTPASPALAQ